jgi:hypothetical protein
LFIPLFSRLTSENRVLRCAMVINKARVAVCTQKGSHDETLIHESAVKYGLDSIYACHNSESLSKKYNEMIDMCLEEDYDCLILVHDDVVLEENPIPKLEKLFDQFDLVGVAGPTNITIQSPCLWHIMGGGFQSGNLHGIVQHFHEGQKYPSNFGAVPQRVVMIDGVFMALSRKCMETIRFDESNPCKFHFYDLDYSLGAHWAQLRVGVGDILITHASPGLREFTEDWKRGDAWFLNKYND